MLLNFAKAFFDDAITPRRDKDFVDVTAVWETMMELSDDLTVENRELKRRNGVLLAWNVALFGVLALIGLSWGMIIAH